MLELVQIDAGSCYPLGQPRRVTHPKRLANATAEDELNFLDGPGLDDAHDLHRVADGPCRSPVETGAGLPETPTECSTDQQWKDPAVENRPLNAFQSSLSTRRPTLHRCRSSSLAASPAAAR